MKKFPAILAAAAFALSLHGAPAEIPPYNPPPAPPMPQHTAIRPDQVEFKSPEGFAVVPGDFRKIRSLNGTWLCSGLETSAAPFPAASDRSKGWEGAGFDDSKWDRIPVPFNWYRHYGYEKIYDPARPYVRGYYRHEIDLPESEISGRSVLLHFNVIGYEATLWVNGKEVGSHHGEFVPWTVDITKYVKPGKNLLALKVLSDFGPTRGDIKLGTHTYGSQWSPPNIKGGIWQDVELRIENPIRIEQMLITPQLAQNQVRIDFTIVNDTGKKVVYCLDAAVTDAMKTDANRLNATSEPIMTELAPGENPGSVLVKLNHPVLWEPDHPQLYFATVYLTGAKQVAAAATDRFGFREFRIKDGKFHLNGRRIYLFGENISAVNFGGFGNREQEEEKLRAELSGYKQLGYNIIRNAHMPMINRFYDIADEIGLMIYDEWGWAFTNAIDEPEFAKRNVAELKEWLARDYNHPSVVMWSTGNEVVHRNNPAIQRQLDRQVDLVRQFGKSGRPAGVFSGSASWTSYGCDPRNTDFLDLHSYLGLSSSPWTKWPWGFNTLYAGNLNNYGIKESRLPMPFIIWECVGFSWGNMTDPKFKPNDSALYAKYVEKPTTWAKGNGIGFAGTIGLDRALKPGSLEYGQAVYGKRILEMIRQDVRVDGFAPWFHGYKLAAATLWNQPVLVGLRNAAGLPPRDFFAGRTGQFELYVANQADAALPDAVATISLCTAPDKTVKLGEFKAAAAAPFAVSATPVEVKIPEGVSGHCQLRVDLAAGGKELSRNFYDVFIQPESLLTGKIETAKKIALLDTGDKDDLESTAAILRALGLGFETVIPDAPLAAFALAIVPAAIHNTARIDYHTAQLLGWVRGGGTLLVLEQNFHNGSLLENFSVIGTGNTFIDLVHPAHPVFSGLDQRNFDTWENPENGFVCEGGLAPFSINAIAVNGPMLGKRNVETAVFEATLGKGRLFATQLAAVKLWGKDSSASTYLVNLFRYLLDGKEYAKVLPLASGSSGNYPVEEKNLVPVDLRKHTNRSFSDEKDNDGKGGWTDQGKNDFRNIPLGLRKASGVVFDVIDPAKNNGTGCIVLAGVQRPNFPDAVKGIPVNAKFSRLFFLHAVAWDGPEAGRYRIHYADGGSADYQLVPGVNIGDWWMIGYLPEAKPGLLAPNPTRDQVGCYVGCWENPYPEREIASLDFLSARYQDSGAINYDLSKAPVPVLIAVTGEKSNPAPLPIDTAARPGAWSKGGNTGKGNPGTATVVETTLPDGTKGKATQIDLPENGDPQNAPYLFVKFAPGEFEPGKADYLSFWIKVNKPGTVDLALPETDWKAAFRATERTGTAGEWRKIRVPLRRTEGAEKMTGKKLRGELFFYNGRNRYVDFPRPQVNFLISGITLE